MRVVYYSSNKDYNLAVNYNDLIGKAWFTRLRKYIQGKEMRRTMYEVHRLYSEKLAPIYPRREEIFAALDKLDVTEINVAIINCNPVFNSKSNGIAFANRPDGKACDLSLSNLFDRVTIYERRHTSSLDYSLEHWIEQYVFLYNVALTGNYGSAHKDLWSEFSRNVIETISDNRQGIIFLFIGTEEQCLPYKTKVNAKKHTVLRHDTLSYDALYEVNHDIESIYGRDFRIKW